MNEATKGRETASRQSRLHIDWTRCDGHSACAELVPELLDVDEWGYPISRTGDRDPVVPPDLRLRARLAERSCPLSAITLTDE